MIRMKEFRKAINRIRLTEMDNEAIINFKVTPVFYQDESNGDEIIEHFELAHEIEYKLYMLTSRPFNGLEKRKENIIRFLEKKGLEVVEPLAGTFIDVFESWLSAHALNDPDLWAEQRMEDWEAWTVGENLHMALQELERYSNSYRDTGDLAKKAIELNADIIDENYYDLWLQDEMNTKLDILESEGLEYFNNSYSDYFGKEFSTEEEARDFVEMAYISFEDFALAIYNDNKEEAYNYLFDEFTELQIFDDQNFVDNYVNAYDLIFTIQKDIVFPAWYKYWKAQGIDKTRATVQKVYKQLKGMSRKPFKEQFMILNIAKDTSHQTGSMMEHYEIMWLVSKRNFDALSDIDVKEWNKELSEIGVSV